MAIRKVAYRSFSSGQFGNESLIGFSHGILCSWWARREKSQYLLLKMFCMFCTLATALSYSPCTWYYIKVARFPYSAKETNLIVEKTAAAWRWWQENTRAKAERKREGRRSKAHHLITPLAAVRAISSREHFFQAVFNLLQFKMSQVMGNIFSLLMEKLVCVSSNQ